MISNDVRRSEQKRLLLKSPYMQQLMKDILEENARINNEYSTWDKDVINIYSNLLNRYQEETKEILRYTQQKLL